MKPTDVLTAEHRVIEQVLDCLEAMAAQAERSGKLDQQPAREAVAFLRNFADKCHHGKEEERLFPAMEALGFPREGGPTAVMRHEHEYGRARVRGMAAAIESGPVEDFARNAREFIDMLRQHIQKEDHCLFSMVNNALSPEAQEKLMAEFEQFEHKDMGAGTHEKFLKIADDLAARYGVAKAAETAGAHHCCGKA